MEGKDNLPIPWRSVCLCRQRHCCDFMQALSSASQFGTSWGAGMWQLCPGRAGDIGDCLVPFLWDVTMMGSLGWLFPVQHPLSQDSAEWSPSVMFTHPALKSLLTSLTTWKQDTGGFYLVWVLGTVEQVGKERANDSTSVPASLVSRLVLEQFLLPRTAPWMQIMNVNPASLFRGQTPQKKGISQGAGVVNRVCLLCALGWVLPPFFSFFFEAFSACEREQDSSWAHSSSWGEDFCPLFVVMQHCAAFSDEEEREGGRTGCQYDCDIWMIYLIPLLSNLTLTLSVNSEPCLRCSCW